MSEEDAVELRDIEIFLTLAEELHFGRTAERLHVSPARISQAIKKQERSVGADLFERTSRTVKLTVVGEQLRNDLRPVYRSLHESVARARLAAQGKTDVLRVGTINSNAYELRAFWEAFRARFPQWGLRIRHNDWSGPFGPLRNGDIDALIVWLPVEEPDIAIGPVLFTEPKVLLMPVGHQLADRDSVSIEELGNYSTITRGLSVPDYWENEYLPFYTPSGRTVEKVVTIVNREDMLAAVSHDGVINTAAEHVARYSTRTRPDVVDLPIHDSPLLHWALVWRSDAENERIRALANVIRELGPMAL
ncbi:LysR family transcriptional regulator [Nocardia sp. NPDC057440]|uniref:LysR family transcriptional regulator n=1 Tax=Nocardia sp. NPDC057440 TaxID=3346134 RepID=UPI003671FD81